MLPDENIGQRPENPINPSVVNMNVRAVEVAQGFCQSMIAGLQNKPGVPIGTSLRPRDREA
jgi:hypothetical protein